MYLCPERSQKRITQFKGKSRASFMLLNAILVNLADLLVSRLLGGQFSALNSHVLHGVVLVRLK